MHALHNVPVVPPCLGRGGAHRDRQRARGPQEFAEVHVGEVSLNNAAAQATAPVRQYSVHRKPLGLAARQGEQRKHHLRLRHHHARQLPCEREHAVALVEEEPAPAAVREARRHHRHTLPLPACASDTTT